MNEITVPTSWEAVVIVLVGIGSLAVIGNQMHELWQRMKGRPTAQEVREEVASEYVTVERCEVLHADHERRLTHLERIREEDLRAAAESRKAMYGKMDEMRREMTAQIESVRDTLGERIDKKTDAIPERVIAILKNTGAIGNV